MAEGGRVAWGAEEAGEGGAGGAGDGGDARYAALMERLHHHQAERGDHTAHVRLRYAPICTWVSSYISFCVYQHLLCFEGMGLIV